MTLAGIHIEGYRSVREMRLPLRRLTVLAGGNGVGKTNLYRSLELLQAAATGRLATEMAREGGLASILFAGERRRGEAPRLVLAAELDDVLEGAAPLTYRIELGFPDRVMAAAFDTEAQVKRELLTLRRGRTEVKLLERSGPSAWARDAAGRRVLADDQLLASETALSGLRGGYPEIDAVRAIMAGWRFYHGFRSDPDSPLRRPALAVTSPALASDGGNLAAVFATLRHIRGDSRDLDEALGEAFPGARLHVPPPQQNASFSMTFPELPNRHFGMHELSDGTLQFLALAGALLGYRLPPFIALNEPETSLHPRLLPPLARLVARAAERSQVWVVTHSHALAGALGELTGTTPREVVRIDGATWIEGLSRIGVFPEDD